MSKKITKFPGMNANKGFRPVKKPAVKTVQDVKLDNSELLELIKIYKEDKNTDNLNKLIGQLVQGTFLLPAVVREDKTPAPKLMKSSEGDTYLGILTDKDQLPADQREGALLVLPYSVINKMAINPVDNIKGLAINPFTDNFVIQRALLEKIEEVEEKRKEAELEIKTRTDALAALGEVVTDENGNKSVKMSEAQYNQFERTQFEVGYLPARFFEHGQAFVDKLLANREECIDEMYENSYAEKRMYPFLPEDFSVMPMTLSDELTIIRVDMPEKDIQFGNSYRVYICWDSKAAQGRYFRITKGKDKDQTLLEEVSRDKKVNIIGDAPVEGNELNTIAELIGYTDPE